MDAANNHHQFSHKKQTHRALTRILAPDECGQTRRLPGFSAYIPKLQHYYSHMHTGYVRMQAASLLDTTSTLFTSNFVALCSL